MATKAEEEPLLTPGKETKPAKIVSLKEATGKEEQKKPSKAKKAGGECVLVVGATGSGKTHTINNYTGSTEPEGEGAESETFEIKKLADNVHKGSAVWIDNPGWLDTTGKSDDDLFKDLLRYLIKNDLTSIKAVVWCVVPNLKNDSVMKRFARLIDMFTVGNDKGLIWSNVLIISKGRCSTIEKDCLGPVSAAKEVCLSAAPRQVGYISGTQDTIDALGPIGDEIRKKNLRELMPDEIRKKLEEELAAMPPSVQVVFANKRCRTCAQTGDPRLMEDKCHKEKVSGHTDGRREKKPHSKSKIAVAYTAGTVAVAGLGTAMAFLPGTELLALGVPAVMGPGAAMSVRRAFGTVQMKYRCCDKTEQEGGCTDVCNKCGVVWGREGGCTWIKPLDENKQKAEVDYEVMTKEHDLEEMV
jgi:energy-coupling factor transporter ATP-binding protein EcfA2